MPQPTKTHHRHHQPHPPTTTNRSKKKEKKKEEKKETSTIEPLHRDPRPNHLNHTNKPPCHDLGTNQNTKTH